MPAGRGWLRRVAGYSGLILAATISFWWSPAPRPSDRFCGAYLHLGRGLGIPFNCDALDFMENARSPSRLLEPRAVRQSRPMFVLLGAALGHPATWAVRGIEASGLLPARAVEKLRKTHWWVGYYVGFVTLNYLALLAALLLFRLAYDRLTAGEGDVVVCTGLMVFLVSNPVTKAFFWTVHQQMLTFLVPVLLLHVAFRLRESSRWRRSLPWLALAGGLLVLVYGSFVLLLPVLLYGAWLEEHRLPATVLLVKGLALVGLFLLPTLCWIGLLGVLGVTFYSHEVEAYGQLVWLGAAWRLPLAEFLPLLGRNLDLFLQTLPTIAPFLVAAAPMLVPGRATMPGRGSVGVLAALLLLQVGFLALLGYYGERLTWGLVPSLLLLAGVALVGLPPRATGMVVLFFALCWHLGQVLSHGPYD